MDKCEECGKDLKEIWAFNTVPGGEHDFCSKKCADEHIDKLIKSGYKYLPTIVNGN